MLTFRDPSSRFRVDAPTLAILPLACREDASLVEAISRRVAGASAQACFLAPVWPYGDGAGSGSSAAIPIRSDTLSSVVRDMVLSLYTHGIPKVAVINGLGSCTDIGALPHGNTVVKTAVRQLNYENPGMNVVWVQPLRAARRQLHNLYGVDLDKDSLKRLLTESLTAAPDETNFTATNTPSKATALDEICRSTAGYIETTFSQLDRIKSIRPR